MKESNLYFVLSGCTANLGVVPLLLLAALRRVPIFTFLADLLFLVTRVLETIYKLPSFLTNLMANTSLCQKISLTSQSISNLKYLSKIAFSVKISLVIYGLCGQYATASTNNQVDTITLARGELYRRHFNNMQKYTIGNKEILRVKGDGKSLIIKALRLGVSDIMIWQKKTKEPKKLKIFVVSKKEEAKLQKLSLELTKLGLSYKVIGRHYTLSGEIQFLEQLDQLKSLVDEYPNVLKLQKLSIRQAVQEANYRRFITDILEIYGDELDCQARSIYISCFEIKDGGSTKKYLNGKYLIKWRPLTLVHKNKQYLIKLKLYQFENLNGHHFSLGLYQLSGQLGDVLHKSPLSLINKNTIALKQSQFQFSTLAEPTIIGRLNQPVSIRLGSDLPYTNTNREGQTTTQWRFAGLSIDLKIKPWGDKLLVEYSNGLSRPTLDSIQSNKQVSNIILNPGNKKLIFDVGFLVDDKQHQYLPGTDSIPLLSKLFQSKQSHKIYKKIIGFIEVKEI